METIVIKNLKKFSIFKKKDLEVWKICQMYNWKEWIHCEIMRIDPKWTGKFIGKLTTHFLFYEQWLKKWDLIIAHHSNIEKIF